MLAIGAQLFPVERRLDVFTTGMMMTRAVPVIGRMFHAHHVRCTPLPTGSIASLGCRGGKCAKLSACQA